VETDSYVHATPAVVDGVAYFGGCDEVFRGVLVTDGREVLTVSAGAYTAASPALGGGKAFFGTFDSEVLAIDLDGRKIAWRFADPDRQFPFYSSPALSEDRVIVGGRDRIVRALDAATGEPLWSFTTRARVESSPAVAGGRVFVGSNDGRFYVLDRAKGTKLWEFEAGAPLSASPAVASGRIVIGSQDGQLFCFG
jgi:eukaryotic-like serine/threonine-protein kinase